MPEALEDALDGLTRRQLEVIAAKAQRRLATCTLCQSDGAFACRVFANLGGRKQNFALMICAACIERERLSERRVQA